MSKRLTVSIAAYNIKDYVENALQSCVVPLEFRQYLEVIVVNDGSSDCTGEIIQEYTHKYPDLFVYIDKENGGYGSTINAALKVAKGKYFRLLDGDDYFDKGALCELLKQLEQTDADLILNDFTICYEKYNRIEKRTLELEDGDDKGINELSLQSTIAMYSFCYKTEILKKNKVEIDEKCFYTDLEFITRPLRYAESYRYVRNNLYRYRIGIEGQSVSRTGMKRHYKDAQKVADSVMCELRLGYQSNNIYRIVEAVACMIVKMAIKSLMCVEISNSNRKIIEQFDKAIKKEFPEVYAQIDRSYLFWILRRTRYWIYPLWRFKGK